MDAVVVGCVEDRLQRRYSATDAEASVIFPYPFWPRCCAIDPSNQRIAVCQNAIKLSVYDARTLTLWFEEFTPVWCVVWLSDSRLACGLLKGEIVIYDVLTRSALHKKVLPYDTFTAAICSVQLTSSDSPDGEDFEVVAAGLFNDIVLCTSNLDDFGYLRGHTGRVNALLSPRDTLLVSASDDNTLRVWRFPLLTCEKILLAHQDRVTCLAAHAAKDLLASGGADQAIHLWDSETWLPLRVMPQVNVVTALAFCPLNSTLYAAVTHYAMVSVDLRSSTSAPTVIWPCDGSIQSIASSKARPVDPLVKEIVYVDVQLDNV
eukprot:m.166661 g.166661  ORF g.166661 m.166661 type:complete len:319 (+) comp53150_c0_seq5:107-1063(+)